MSYSKRTPLSPTFQPGPYDVICARGKQAHAHEGNQRFRELVHLYRHRYAAASTKYEKSQIVSHITNVVRTNSPEGGFVKQFKNGSTNTYGWYEVGDRAAKEKIGQTMRDQLHTKYSSSTKAKARVRIQKRVQEYKDSEQQQGNAAALPELARSAPNDEAKSCGVSIISTDSTVIAATSNNNKPDMVPSLIQVTARKTTDSEMPPLRPSSMMTHPGMFIPANYMSNNEPSGESLLDALFQPSATPNNNEDPFQPLEPISLNSLQPTTSTSSNVVEFHDSDLRIGQEDLLDFCNTMGVAC